MKFKQLSAHIKGLASGRWEEIILATTQCGSLPTRKNGPCPKCGGDDRCYVTKDFKTSGAVRCRKCPDAASCGDGIGSVAWIKGISNQEALHEIADYLAVEYERPKQEAKVSFVKYDLRNAPESAIKMISDDVRNSLVPANKPCTKEGFCRAGIQIGNVKFSWKHRNNNDWVVAFPRLNKDGEAKMFVMMRTNGEKFEFNDRQQKKISTSKVANGAGYSGSVEGKEVFLVEGETDLAAIYSIMPDGKHYSAYTTGGAGIVLHWLTERLEGKTVYVIGDQGDADDVGQKGALKQCLELSRNKNIQVKNVQLDGTGKYDLRKWLSNPANTWDHLLSLCQSTEVFKAKPEQSILELDPTDPERLAIANLRQYESGNKKLIYWKDRWYRYKTDHYEEIADYDLEPKVRGFIQEEFKRIWRNTVDNWDKPRAEPPAYPQKVTSVIVREVIKAMKVICQTASNVSFPGWLDDPERNVRNIVPLKNGLIDIDEMIEGYTDAKIGEESKFLYPHTHNFFSSVCLDYKFEGVETADLCNTTFWKFMRDSFPGKRGATLRTVLQQWLGYLLVQDNTFNKFLLMYGGGANGKTVFCTIIKALLGSNNCASGSLEFLASRFEASFFHDRLVNIIDEASDIDSTTVNTLKRMTGGGSIRVEQKGKPAVFKESCCRFIICCNHLPQFSDVSKGISRRLLTIPWEVEVPKKDQRPEFLTVEFWKKSGELPVIFAWALQGLIDLRRYGRFATDEQMESEAEEIAQTSLEVDWANKYLDYTEDPLDYVVSSDLGDSYFRFSKERGIRPKFQSNSSLARWLKNQHFRGIGTDRVKGDDFVRRRVLTGLKWKEGSYFD